MTIGRLIKDSMNLIILGQLIYLEIQMTSDHEIYDYNNPITRI